MEVGSNERPRVPFAVVSRGWDPAEVSAFVEDMGRHVALLQRRLDRAEKELAARDGAAPGGPEATSAEAEDLAVAIRDRALATARRIRRDASEGGRDITLEARREALDIVRQARSDADRIVAKAREVEQELHGRVRTLLGVVRRTEALLLDVAHARLDGDGVGDAAGDGRKADIEVVVASEQARVERRLHRAGRTGGDEPLPDSVERLLHALRDGRSREA